MVMHIGYRKKFKEEEQETNWKEDENQRCYQDSVPWGYIRKLQRATMQN